MDFAKFLIRIGQPREIDEFQNAVVGRRIVISVTLQYFSSARRVFNGNERHVGLFFRADKENQRVFPHEFLIVPHPTNAMIEQFAFTDKLGRTLRNHGDINGLVVVFKPRILVCNGGESIVKCFPFFFVLYRFCGGVFVDADIVPTLEIVGITVFIFDHIQTEILTSVKIIPIRIRIIFLP